MTDWNNPQLSQTWANRDSAIKGRDESLAKMDFSADSNIPTNSIRWSGANSRFEIWDGSTWSALTSTYSINVSSVNGISFPNTIGNILTDHDKAAHDSLNINADTVDGQHASAFLGVSDKAADSNLLDGINSTSFLRSDTADTKNSGHLTFSDNVHMRLGSGADTRMYHNGSHTFIDHYTGNIYIRHGTTSRFLFVRTNGDLHADGDGYFFSTSVGSDERYKELIEPIPDALDAICALTGWKFSWKEDGSLDLGLTAQGVQQFYPELVRKTKRPSTGEEFLHLNYNGVIAVLVQAVKQLNARI